MWTYEHSNDLYHYGIKGMKWGVRRTPAQLGHLPTDSSVTKKVKDDYNRMSDDEFRAKYRVSKSRYAKRVSKYGDPYMNSPLAKAGKKLKEKEKSRRAARESFADKYVKYLNKSLSEASADLDKPYRQPIGNGVYANWSSKRKFIEAEIDRVRRDQQNGKPFSVYDDEGRIMKVSR